MRRSALLVRESRAIDSRGNGALVDSGRDVDVLVLRGVVFELFIMWSETREIESRAGSGSVGEICGSGANTASTKASEERSTVVLLRHGHLGGIGTESEVLFEEVKWIAREFESNWEGRLS